MDDDDDTVLEPTPLERDWFEPPDVCDVCGRPIEEGQRMTDTKLCEYHCRRAKDVV